MKYRIERIALGVGAALGEVDEVDIKPGDIVLGVVDGGRDVCDSLYVAKPVHGRFR